MPRRTHTPGELRYAAGLIDTDAVTVLATCRAGVSDLAGSRIKETQLQASESTHVIVLRTLDARALNPAGYIRVDDTLYVIDYTSDPRNPQPGMWLEVYCHAQRGGA